VVSVGLTTPADAQPILVRHAGSDHGGRPCVSVRAGSRHPLNEVWTVRQAGHRRLTPRNWRVEVGARAPGDRYRTARNRGVF
jgi:hypothetical protein